MSSKKLLLVIDDSAPERTVLASFLRKLGFDVQEAKDAKEALNLLSPISDPGLVNLSGIFCDIMMPDLDGTSFLEIVREREAFKKVPFVAVSSHGDDFFKNDAKRFGAIDYLVKPVTISKLETLLKTLGLI